MPLYGLVTGPLVLKRSASKQCLPLATCFLWRRQWRTAGFEKTRPALTSQSRDCKKIVFCKRTLVCPKSANRELVGRGQETSSKQRKKPSNLAQHVSEGAEDLEAILESVQEKFVDSMPDRVNAVIAAEGGPTKY